MSFPTYYKFFPSLSEHGEFVSLRADAHRVKLKSRHRNSPNLDATNHVASRRRCV
jgi:hypothetical protein